MSINEQSPMNRTTITIVAVVLLFAAGLAYSQGWFDWSSPAPEIESDKVSTNQVLDQEETKADAVQVAQETAKPADTATE
jgi:hypothetical protein